MIRLGAAVLIVSAVVPGCSQFQISSQSPLSPPQMTSESAAVDIFFVRVPFSDPNVENLWSNVDEQVIPQQLRKELYRNGFRVGRIAGPIPQAVAEILRLTDAPVGQVGLESKETVSISEDSPPVRRHLQVRPGHRAELLASGVYEELPFLRRNDQGQVVGQTLQKAQGIFSMTLYPKSNGTVCVQLVPELHYGEPRLQPITSEGLIRWEMRRDRIVLGDLGIKVDLAPGDMVILTCTPDQPGSLGGRFFTAESSGKREQKLIAIRLSQVQTNSAFQPPFPATAARP